MALLPFLGAGHTTRDGEFSENVRRGLTYLMESMQIGPSGGALVDHGNMYSHGLAAIALSEAYAMTQNSELKLPAQRALDYIAYAQDPVGGGWRYAARQAGDTSMVGWQIMALQSGSMAYLEVDPAVMQKAEQFLDGVQADGGATYGYIGPGDRPATSSIGLLCRMYLGWSHKRPALKRGVQQIAARGPSEVDMYYNYYATQLLFQYARGKGTLWTRWNMRMRDRLIQLQEKNGHETGSWFMANPHSSVGGRLYCTSLATLILEVYYRHLPIHQESATAAPRL
jgi:hypothetical protein